MNIEQVRDFTLSLHGVTEDQPFGDDNITFRVEGKIFLCLWLDVHTNRLLSIFLLLTVETLHLHAELIGKDSVEEDADDSSESQT